MHSRVIPIFFINSTLIPIKIKLVSPKCYQKVFWQPLFFIRILVFHSYLLHYAAASGVVPVMRCRNIRQTIFFHLFYHRYPCFCNNSLMPKFLAKSISEIVMFFRIYFDIADRKIILFETDRIGVCLRLGIF